MEKQDREMSALQRIHYLHIHYLYAYITYTHTLPRRVCAAQRDRDFEAPDLFRTGYPFQRRFLDGK